MEYKVVPFIATIDLKKNTSALIAEQLETTIRYHNEKGWKYVRMESITTFLPQEFGCFGFGAKPARTLYNQVLVFQQ